MPTAENTNQTLAKSGVSDHSLFGLGPTRR
jgi:hypothetical protein